MKTYIALLRGINVSGKNCIKMQELSQLVSSLGFQSVKTYIQSGNVLFQSEIDNDLHTKLSAAIYKTFQLQIDVLVFSVDEIREIINQNPFPAHNSSALYYTFFRGELSKDASEQLNSKKADNEDYEFGANVLYFNFGNGYAKTKLSTNFVENKLKVIATTRNSKTMNTLLEMSNSL